MGKKTCCLPPGALDELITRIEKLEENQAALEGAINAFVTVFAVRRLEDPGGNVTDHGDGEHG